MGAFKLGKMTFGSLFKKPETIQYPFQTKPQPMGLKGHIRCDVDACILCGMCERSCTTDCIKVDKQARTWTIDAFGCVQCGYCTTVCPKDCLYMEPDYHPAATAMSADTFAVPEQKGAPQAASKKARDAEKAVTTRAEMPTKPSEQATDDEVEKLLKLMPQERADKVRASLGR